MRRNNLKNFIYNGGKTSTSQALMYQHMSNHYRKILNAKKAVDSSAPRYFKPRRTSTSSPSPTRSISPNKRIISRNTSPVLTERSVSTNSYGGSCWEAESCISKKISHRSRYQESKRGRSPSNVPNVDMELIDRIVFDTKHGPATYFDVNWESNRIETNVKNYKNFYDVKKSRSNPVNPTPPNANIKRKSLNRSRICPLKRMFIPKEKIPPDIMDRHSEFFASYSSEFYPRILKSDSPSKLKDLKVYHPPRRKAGSQKSSWMENEDSSRTPVDCTIKQSQCKCSETCSCERNENLECKCKSNKEQSQTSSRDSAYNGGVSSLPESRSPTPDQKKGDMCRCKTKNQELGDESTEESDVIHPININTEYEVSDEKEEKGKKPKEKMKITRHSSGSPKYLKSFKNKSDEEYLKKIKEDSLYTKLIEDITSEVLQKGLYTNKALKKVMKRHLTANLGILDKDRMLKEVDNLRVQLGIPEDDSLLNLQTDESDSCSDVRECCPVISDSVFFVSDPDETFLKAEEIKNLSYSWTSHHYLKKKQQQQQYNHHQPDEKIPDRKMLHKSISATTENEGDEEEKLVGMIDDDESVSIIQLKKILDKTKVPTPTYSASYPNKSDDTSSEEDAEKIMKRRRSRVRDSPVRRKTATAKISDSSDESEDEKTVKEILPKTEEMKQITESPKKKNVNFSSDEREEKKRKEESVPVAENESQGSKVAVNALYLKTTRKGTFDPSPLYEESEFVLKIDGSGSTIASSEGSKLTNSGKM